MKKSILVVDDDKSILGSFKIILEAEGYDVDTAETGRAAIERSKTGYYNLTLLDIKLPDMDGTKLLTKLHNNVPKMMKVMVTGHASLDNAVISLNLGADAYVTKPVNPEDLLKVVDDKLREQESAKKMGQDQVNEWIETRIRKLEGRA